MEWSEPEVYGSISIMGQQGSKVTIDKDSIGDLVETFTKDSGDESDNQEENKVRKFLDNFPLPMASEGVM